MEAGTDMLAEVRRRLPELEAICRRHHVRYLAIFGSAATGQFEPKHSDLDFLIDYDDDNPDYRAWNDYWEVKQALERMFGRPVDLVDRSAQRNLYFIRSIEATKQLLYAA